MLSSPAAIFDIYALLPHEFVNKSEKSKAHTPPKNISFSLNLYYSGLLRLRSLQRAMPDLAIFKWINKNLKVKTFLSTSRNPVLTPAIPF